MNVLIIEDEPPARARLSSMLTIIDPTVRIINELGSVRESLAWFRENAEPDLIFADIQLSDDHSFEIFREHPVKCPMIFTTAYDKYLLDSFEFSSVDYLLKPITDEKLRRALDKIKKLEQHFVKNNFGKMLDLLQKGRSGRLLARKGSEHISIPWEDVAYIFSEHKICFLKTRTGSQFILNRNLAELESDLDRKLFFRLNRKFIAHISSIEKFKSDNGKIRVFLKPEVTEEVHVSKEMAPEFRKWMAGEQGNEKN